MHPSKSWEARKGIPEALAETFGSLLGTGEVKDWRIVSVSLFKKVSRKPGHHSLISVVGKSLGGILREGCIYIWIDKN